MTGDIESDRLLKTSNLVLDDTALAGLLHNARLLLAPLAAGSYRQIAGPFGPRKERGYEDGIPFTANTARRVYQHLRQHDVLCRHIVLRANNQEMHSLVIAIDARGIGRALRDAEKTAAKIRARLTIMPETDG